MNQESLPQPPPSYERGELDTRRESRRHQQGRKGREQRDSGVPGGCGNSEYIQVWDRGREVRRGRGIRNRGV